MSIKRVSVSAEVEKKIIAGIIIDDNFCGGILRMGKKDFFKNEFARRVFVWCEKYYRKYKESPKKNIESIFLAESEKMKEADSELLRNFLLDISDEKFGEKVNYEYFKDQARLYFRERALTLLADKINGELALNRIEQAETEVRNFSKIVQDMSYWFNPLEAHSICQVFAEDESNLLFRFDGALGDMIGYFERDWLVAFMAPMKRGKSWWCQEVALEALAHGLKVAYFSLEMNKNAISKRLYKRITAEASKSGLHYFPVFDCERNQDGTCKKEERTGTVAIKAPGAETPEFSDVKGYIPCQRCRLLRNGDFVLTTWKSMKFQKEDLSDKSTIIKVNHFKKMFGNNLRVMAYPAFSASFDDIEADLEELEYLEGFVPDVICVDYFDISNPGKAVSGFSERAVADYIWKRGKGVAAKRHCLMVTVLQSNRKSISKKSLEQEDTAEDIRKMAHPDIVLGFNQTPDEKVRGVSRFGIVAHRHMESIPNEEVLMLQSFALGQPRIDDELVKMKNSKKK